MLTTVMRSVSSDYIRSVARRAMRTREGKGRLRGFVLVVSAPLSADHGSLVLVGSSSSEARFGGQATETLMLP